MLLQGCYDFTPRLEDSHKTLGFSKGDTLMFLDAYPKNLNWLRVADSGGRIGYIPRNYVELSDIEVNRDSALQFVAQAILKARREKLSSLETLEKLKDDVRRIEFREFQTRLLRQALHFRDPEPEAEIDDGTTYTCESEGRGNNSANYEIESVASAPREHLSHISMRTEPPRVSPPAVLNSSQERNQHDPTFSGRLSHSCHQIDNSPSNCGDKSLARRFSPPHVPKSSPSPNKQGNRSGTPNWERMAAKLINIVQESGGGNLDLKRSETIVHRLLYNIRNDFSNTSLPESISSVIRVLERSPTSTYSQSLLGEGGNDSPSSSIHRANQVLTYLTKSTKHSLHTRGYIEEESALLDKLDQLEEDLGRMDGKTMKRVIEPKVVQDLMNFYQSEKRDSIKSKMIEIFSMISTLDTDTKFYLVKSALPILLANELLENEASPTKLSRIAVTLMKLLSSSSSNDSQTLPQTHLDALGGRFLNFIFNYLEDSPDEDVNMTTKSDLIILLLAYNLHFSQTRDENLVTKTLAGREPGRNFMEGIMNLFESGVDPVRHATLREGPQHHVHSVLKLLQDIFSSKKTADHWHKADMKWLTDLIYTNISNLGPGNERRTEYLQLLKLVVRNRAFQYRLKEIREALIEILLEEDPLSIPDQRIVKSMSKEFPTIFKKTLSGQNIPVGGNNRINPIDTAAPF